VAGLAAQDFSLIRQPIDFLRINYYTRSVALRRQGLAAPACAVRQNGDVY
jgi:hypothetical protein